MTTLYPTLLLTGLALAAAPVVLHLLNRRQRKTVRWAAMEFLLESRARNQTWVNLKQWLLLAARVLAMVLAALMVARPELAGGWAEWLPGEPVHHVVLLDDSFSMSDRGGEASPWRRAVAGLDAIAARAAATTSHRLTVVRSSSPAAPIRVANKELAGFRKTIAGWATTETAGGFATGCERLVQTAGGSRADEKTVAYLLSDFRRRDLADPASVQDAVAGLAERCSAVTAAPCAEQRHNNLAVAGLSLEPSAAVAGVELTAVLAVTNHGAADAENVAVRITRSGAPLPAVRFDRIPAGETASQRFPVRFRSPGAHHLMATAPGDAVEADNRRWLAVDLPSERSVLVVDGSGGGEGLAFGTALRPSRRVGAGWRPVACTPDALDGAGDLSAHAAVLLLDVARVSERAARALTRYAADGGGVLMVLGEHIDRRFYNRSLLADADQPLLPIRLGLPTQTPADRQGRPPALRSVEHPALRVFAGERSRFLDLVRVGRRHTSAGDPGDRVRPLLSLETGAPLLLESTTGEAGGSRGRVLCLMTSTARPPKQLEGWSNLSVSPLFPVLVNELTAYAAAPRLLPRGAEVGDPWQQVVGDLLPDAARLERWTDDAFVTIDSGAAAGSSRPGPGWGAAEASGVHRLSNTVGQTASVSVNVDAGEGDLSLLGESRLRDLFSGDGVSVVAAAELAGKAERLSVGLHQQIGLVLLALLLAEQGLAYACSYHHAGGARGGAA